MKKLMLIGVAVVALFVLAACSAREAITASDFEMQMARAGYSVQDVTTQVDMSSLVSYHIAYLNNTYVEFLVLETESRAIRQFNDVQRMFIGSRGNVYSYRVSSASNFNRFSQTSNGEFLFVGRVDNTILLLMTDSDSRSKADEIISLFGY